MSAFYIRTLAQLDLVLTAYDGHTAITWIDSSFNDKYQQWTMEATRVGEQDAVFFTNVGNGERLTIAPPHRGSAIELGGVGTPWMLTAFGEGTVIQPCPDNNLVMNLLGPKFQNRSTVALWDWSRGQTNELWRIDEVGTIAPYTSQVAFVESSTVSLGMKASMDHPFVGPLSDRINPTELAMLWTLTTWQDGISLRNKGTGQWIAFGAMNTQVSTTAEMAVECVWALEQNWNRVWYYLTALLDPTSTLCASGGVPKNDAWLETLGRIGTDQLWNIQAREGAGPFKPFEFHQRSKKILG